MMMLADKKHFALTSQRVVLSAEQVPGPAVIEIKDGKIAAIIQGGTVPFSVPLIDCGNSVLMAGIVDTHAHINEPGRTEWEGFRTAARAAAAGGITSIVDMPLNSIPATVSLEALRVKSQAAAGQCAIDYGFWGGVIPGNVAELEPMVRAGIVGFKAFMIDSGVEEFPMSREADLRAAMKALAKAGVPLLAHAEVDNSPPSESNGGPRAYAHYLASRPQKWEVDAIRLLIRLVRETGCAAHIVHLSAADALVDIAAARKEGLPLTVETCPHYLSLRAEEIPDGATHYKCAPPIRESTNQDRLWAALLKGDIDMIVSDHSPCTPKLKDTGGDFGKAWGGIAGLQFSLSVIWTEMRRRKIPLERLTRWMSAAPARLAGWEKRKGALQVGNDADIVVWNPDKSFALTSDKVLHRHSLTPYSGREWFGVVQKSFVRGLCVFDEGQFRDSPVGQETLRSASGGSR